MCLRFGPQLTGAGDHISDTSTLGDYIQLLRRRKWIVLQAAILVPLAVLAFTLSQDDLFQGEAQVLLNSEDPTQAIRGDVAGRESADELDRDASTQADVAQTPALARRVLRSVGADGQTAEELLDETSVDARSGSDLLTFKVRDPDPERARRLADAYASEYVSYRRRLGSEALDSAKRDVQRRLANVSSDLTSSQLARDLRTTLRRIETASALQGADATVVRRADEAEKVQPKPVRNTAIGLVLGLVLGVALAFLRDLFDRRVRSADEAAALVGLPLLARCPDASSSAAGPAGCRSCTNRTAPARMPTEPSCTGFRW